MVLRRQECVSVTQQMSDTLIKRRDAQEKEIEFDTVAELTGKSTCLGVILHQLRRTLSAGCCSMNLRFKNDDNEVAIDPSPRTYSEVHELAGEKTTTSAVSVGDQGKRRTTNKGKQRKGKVQTPQVVWRYYTTKPHVLDWSGLNTGREANMARSVSRGIRIASFAANHRPSSCLKTQIVSGRKSSQGERRRMLFDQLAETRKLTRLIHHPVLATTASTSKLAF